MNRVETLDDIPNDYLKSLYRRWTSLDAVDGVPAKALLDGQLLGEVSCFCKIGILEEPFRIRYEVVGKCLQDLYNKPIKGKYLDELFDPWIRKQTAETYEVCAKEKVAIYNRKSFTTLFKKIGYEYLLLPFSENTDSSDVTVFLSCLFPLDMSMVKYTDWQDHVIVTPWLK